MQTRDTNPLYWSEYYFERQAGQLYNRSIFYRFQESLKGTTRLNVKEIDKDECYEVYKSDNHAMREFRPRKYIVLVNLPQEEFSCICAMFQKDGILCAHILRVVIHLNMTRLPEKYFIDRWRPKERKDIRNKENMLPLALIGDDSQLRFNILSRRLVELASEASKSIDKYSYLMNEIVRIEDHLSNMAPSAPSAVTTNETNGSDNTAAEDNSMIHIYDPENAQTKGRPLTVGRQKTLVEQLRSKQQITCSLCGSHTHNIQKCPKRHLDIAPAKKKKRTAAKKTGNDDRG